MLTSPDEIWTPDFSTEFKPTIDLAAMADSIQAAITRSSGGLVPIRPTSASGGTILSDGRVNVANATAVDIDGVFTSRFDHYLIKVARPRVAAGNAEVTMRMRSNGVTRTQSEYGYIAIDSGEAGTVTPVRVVTNPEMVVGNMGVIDGYLEISGDVYNEFGVVSNFDARSMNGANLYKRTVSARHEPLGGPYDGFRLGVSSSSFSAIISVFGYAR